VSSNSATTRPSRKHQPNPQDHRHVASSKSPHSTSLHTLTDSVGASEVPQIPRYSVNNGFGQRHLAVTWRKHRGAHDSNHRAGRPRAVGTVGKWQRAGTAVQVQDVQSYLGMYQLHDAYPFIYADTVHSLACSHKNLVMGLTSIPFLPPTGFHERSRGRMQKAKTSPGVDERFQQDSYPLDDAQP